MKGDERRKEMEKAKCYNSYNSEDGNYIVMRTSYGDIKIKNVVIVGDLCDAEDNFWTSHLVNATRVEQLDSYTGCGYNQGVHNIFFTEFGQE